MQYQVAEDHGFTDIADFVIMDEDGSVSIPVEGGTRMTENLVGAHFPEYDGFLVLSHFKGHAIAGFGGAIKNISIGMASQEGKCLIHTDGASHTSPWGGAQDPFLECMAEAGKSVQDSVDLIYAAEDGASLVQRMESRNAEHVLQHGEEIGLGNRSYDLISVFAKDAIHSLFAGLKDKKMGIWGVIPASLLGTLSPLCMYGTIPIAASFSRQGMRDDWLAAFMMSSILLNPQLMLYSTALGGTVLAVRIISCILCGMAAGVLVRIFFRKKECSSGLPPV